MKRIAMLVFFATAVFAQSANVIELEPADGARVQKAWDALQKAQADWDAVHHDIEMKYTTRPGNTGGAGMCVVNADYCYKEAFDDGFEFSTDFKFIVPKNTEPTRPQFQLYANPASGTFKNCCSQAVCICD